MGKLLLFLSFACLTFVGIGTFLSPDSSLFYMASSEDNYQRLRIAIGIVIGVQLLTRPPRHVWFRVIAGSLAVATGFWAVQETYNYHMQLLDVMAFLSASCAMFATALERGFEKAPAVYVRGKLIVS
ncbi:MAG: hypothetical protein ABIV43_04030 [Candidatus Saccharimonadales bacterium]